MRRETIMGIPINYGSKDDMVKAVAKLIGVGGTVFTPNAEIMNMTEKSEYYRELISTASLNIPDGISVVRALARRGIRSDVLPGVELGEELLSAGHSFAIIGGAEGVAARAGRALYGKYPKSTFLFSRSGYGFRIEDIKKQLALYTPELVFVCLGAPKQELLIEEVRDASPKTVYIALGGAVDIYAGDKKRAPRAMRRLGLEWLYRMIKEPKRIAKIPSIVGFLYGERRERRDVLHKKVAE